MKNILSAALVAVLLTTSVEAGAQKYKNGLVDKSVAVVGNELITLSNIEQEVQMMRAQGMSSDQGCAARCSSP